MRAQERMASGAINPAPDPEAVLSPRMRRCALAGVLLLSAGLNLYRLNREGFANLYYAAGVRSMLTSWHNAFFVSFDPSGFVAIDKPPVGFWLQALSARLFGFHGWSILLPQAVAAVVSVGLLYRLVGRAFGPLAGILAALALAITPIDVVTARDNTIDSLLVPVVLLAAWTAFRAAETGRLRFLLLCGLLFGIGFNIKSLEALLALPACFLLYQVTAPRRWWWRCLHLAAASLVVAVVSLAWVVAVDLTPTADRPYVGSTADNSELSLIIGHNGLDRLLPRRPTFRDPGKVRIGNGSSAYETGAPGPLRLVNPKLAGQLDWLLPLGLLGFAVAVAAAGRPRRRLTERQRALLLWGAWFASEAVFFSSASYFHRYYLVVLTPAMAAMFGIGLAALWTAYRRGGWRAYLLPAAVLSTAALQTHVLDLAQGWRDWRALPIAAAAIGLVLLLFRAGRLAPVTVARLAFTASVALLLAAPMAWTVTTVDAGQLDPSSPLAGTHRPANVDPDQELRQVAPVVAYLEEHRGQARFLLATANAREAAPFVLASGLPVMALGGYSGSDPILTSGQLAAAVAAGKVRYFLVRESLVHRAWRPQVGAGPLAWVVGHCVPVSSPTRSFTRIAGPLPAHSPALVQLGETSYALYACTPASVTQGGAG